ncbi:MAG: Holliday junction resolvase RuvX [Candidatus Peregrinibacteria bacterium]|nr:Holliday junction resolvase RuvX [Candidatus Peregrinibacteria bacterium]MCB9808456.1 Holliday junction resolvase RuvX [Candidatus Peribacteria bacterium]
MRLLGLDVGTRKTGVAFGSTDDGIVFSLPTISHVSEDQLSTALLSLISEKSIDEVVLGLPLLPSGEEGAQASVVRSLFDRLRIEGISCHLLDERYTTPTRTDIDPDAASACEIVNIWLDLNKYN